MYSPRKQLLNTFNVDFLYFYAVWKITELRFRGQKSIMPQKVHYELNKKI